MVETFGHFLESWQARRGTLRVGARFWASSVWLAAARLHSNEGRRSARRDRQQENLRVDLMGAASELLLYRTVERFVGAHSDESGWSTQSVQVAQHALGKMEGHLFVPEGGEAAIGADLVFGSADLPHAIDAKSFDFGARKKYFAINKQKHVSLGDTRPHYFCMICPPFARSVLVCLVPYADVEVWETKSLGGRVPPDPAVVSPIDEFMCKYLGQTFNTCREFTTSRFRRKQVELVLGEARDLIVSLAANIAPILDNNSSALQTMVDQMLPTD
jgi:hypothetical protein